MHTALFETAGDFLRAARAFLEVDQVINSVPLGISEWASQRTGPAAGSEIFAAVYDGESVSGTGVMSGHYLLLSGGPTIVDSLVAALREAAVHLPGVTGLAALSDAFAAAWTAAAGGTYEQVLAMSVYRLTAVNPPAYAPGAMRLATDDDVPLLAQWSATFQAEATPHDPPRDHTAVVRQKIDSGSLYVWEDGGAVVSMAATARPTRDGITVNYVYTPPALRGKGYATSCVARLSQRMLDDGYRFCMLFADHANPTSTGIYRRLGYQPLGDFHAHRFETPAD